MINNHLKLVLLLLVLVLTCILIMFIGNNNKALANQGEWYKAYEYELDREDNTMTLDKYIGDATEIEVFPTATINEVTYNVLLNQEVFHQQTDITSITIHPGVKSTTSCYFMFSGCSSLTSLDLSDFNTSSCTDMSYMFNGCENITSLNLSDFDTSNVISMNNIFRNCKSLTKIDISSFDTTKVGVSLFNTYSSRGYSLDSHYEIKMAEMFYGCKNIKEIKLGKKFQFKKCTLDTGKITELTKNTDNFVELKHGIWVDSKGINHGFEDIPSNVEETYTFKEEKIDVYYSDYNVFEWEVDDEIDVVGYVITDTPEEPTSGWITEGTLEHGSEEIDANTPKAYYVWAKDNNGEVGYGTISSYKLTKSEGEGTVLKLFDMYTRGEELGTTCVVAETPVYVHGELKDNYNTLLITGPSHRLIGDQQLWIERTTTISSKATPNDALIFNNQTKVIGYSENEQIIFIDDPQNDKKTYEYKEISEFDENGEISRNLEIDRGTIIVSANTPIGTYTYTVRATERETGLITEGDVTITVIESSVAIAYEEKIIEDQWIIVQPNTTKAYLKNKIISTSNYSIFNEKGEELADNAVIKTENKIIVDEGIEYLLIVKGDANKDGIINLNDILEINKYRLRKKEYSYIQFLAVDLKEDNKISIEDILKLNKYRLGKISIL